MSKRKMEQQEQERRRRARRRVAALLAVVVLVGAGLWLWSAESPLATGTPRLEVDQAAIDFGYVRYEKWVEATFTLRNAGDGSLKIAEAPRVRAVQGC